LVVVGALVMPLALAVGWCAFAIAGDFADLGSVAVQAGDDGTGSALVAAILALLLFVAGLTTVVLASRLRR
jgi:hypothetical protein